MPLGNDHDMAPRLTPQLALQNAIDALGSQAAMSRLCGVSQPSVFKWIKRSKPLPAEHVLKVEAATGVSKHDLRPDIYPRDAAVLLSGAATVGAGGSPSTGSRAESDPMSGLNP